MMYVALLRGINVGGNNTVSMTQLKKLFEELGYKDITTYINSGNVIFSNGQTNPRQLEEEIEKELEKTFGFPIRVVVRSFDEMEEIIKQIPKHWEQQNDPLRSEASWRHNIIFLSHRIDNKNSFTDLTPKPNIEEMKYIPGVLLWTAKTSDLTHSTMITINKSKFHKEMTVRNLNTARKIYELMQNLQTNPHPSS